MTKLRVIGFIVGILALISWIYTIYAYYKICGFDDAGTCMTLAYLARWRITFAHIRTTYIGELVSFVLPFFHIIAPITAIQIAKKLNRSKLDWFVLTLFFPYFVSVLSILREREAKLNPNEGFIRQLISLKSSVSTLILGLLIGLLAGTSNKMIFSHEDWDYILISVGCFSFLALILSAMLITLIKSFSKVAGNPSNRIYISCALGMLIGFYSIILYNNYVYEINKKINMMDPSILAVGDDICKGNGNSQTALYDPLRSGFHPIIISHFTKDLYAIPELIPRDINHVELVACIEDVETKSACNYTGGKSITVVSSYSKIIIRIAQTAVIVNTTEVYPTDRSNCPNTITEFNLNTQYISPSLKEIADAIIPLAISK
jgi:hypothetical protein